MELRTIKVTKINPAPYNPRVNLDRGSPEYERIRASLNEFGLVEPLVWNERTGNLVGGHQRLRVLVDGGAATVDVAVVDLDEAKERALNLALNKVGGQWDDDKLAALLGDMTDDAVLLGGFALDERDDVLLRSANSHATEFLDEFLNADGAKSEDDGKPHEEFTGTGLIRVSFAMDKAQRDVVWEGLRKRAEQDGINRTEALVELCKAYVAGG